MKLSIAEIVNLFQGTLEGNAELEITELCKIEEGKPHALSFLANPKYISQIYTTEAAAVLVANDFVPEKEIKTTLIRVENPYAAFTMLLTQYFSDRFEQSGVESLAYVHPEVEIADDVYVAGFAYISKGCKIGKNVKIFPQVFLGENVVIGDNTILFSGVKIYRSCQIGSKCTIHSGTVIGSDGFGFAPDGKGGYIKIPQTGIVVIEDEVEVGSNTSIDRATLGETRIKKGAKIDNLVQIAHNTVVGENTVIAAQAGISGSTKIGKYCMIGGQVGVVGHIELADGTQVGAQSGVSKSYKKPGKALRGSPAQDIKNQLKSEVLFQQLPELLQRIQKLEQIISDWKKD